MTIKTTIAAAILALVPAIGMACASKQHQTQSCAPGMVWDSGSHTCVKQITG